MNEDQLRQFAKECDLDIDDYPGYVDSANVFAFARMVAKAERERCANECKIVAEQFHPGNGKEYQIAMHLFRKISSID